MPGIVRGVLIEAAPAAGIELREAPIEAAALDGASLFLTNSLMGLRPATLKGGGGGVSRVLDRLQTCYGEAMKRDLDKRAQS